MPHGGQQAQPSCTHSTRACHCIGWPVMLYPNPAPAGWSSTWARRWWRRCARRATWTGWALRCQTSRCTLHCRPAGYAPPPRAWLPCSPPTTRRAAAAQVRIHYKQNTEIRMSEDSSSSRVLSQCVHSCDGWIQWCRRGPCMKGVLLLCLHGSHTIQRYPEWHQAWDVCHVMPAEHAAGWYMTLACEVLQGV